MIKTSKMDFDIKGLLKERSTDKAFIDGLYNDIEPKIFLYRPDGVDLAVKLITGAKRVLVYYDPDVDGTMAGEMVSELCRFLRIPYFQYVNNNRYHGFSNNVLNTCIKNRIDTCIAVDFTIEYEYIQKLNANNINVICVDHHVPQDIPKQSRRYTLINNQYKQKDCPDSIKTLSGAGVVYYFCYWVLRILGTEYGRANLLKLADKWLNESDYKVLVGITLLSDSRDIENEICRYFLHHCYNYWEDTKYSEFITRFRTNDYNFGTTKIERNFIDFEFSPVINSLFRFNKGLLVIDAVNKLEITDDLLEYKNLQRTLVDYLYDNTNFNEYPKLIQGVLDLKSLDCSNVIPVSANVDNFVGLIASRAKDGYNKTSWIIAEGDRPLNRGSVRGHDSSFDYMSIFRKYVIANGHTMAFGTYSGKSLNLPRLNEDLTKYDIQGLKYSHLETSNLKMLLRQQDIKKIAYINMFLKSDRQILIEYRGSGVNLKLRRGIAREYDVDGVRVVAFSERTDRIHPVLVSGYLQLFFE